MNKTLLCAITIISAATAQTFGEQNSTPFEIDEHLGTRWYGAYIGGRKVGHAVAEMVKTTCNDKPAYSSSLKIVMGFAAMGNHQKLTITEKNTYYAAGPLVESVSSMGPMGEISGTVDGGTMRITSTIGGAKTQKQIPAPAVSLDDETAVLRLVLSKPKIGDSVSCSAFEPISGKTLSVEFTFTGMRTMPINGADASVLEIKSHTKEVNLDSLMLFDEAGEVLEFSIPMGTMSLALKRAEQKQALGTSDEPVDVLDASTVRPEGTMPDLLGLQELRLRISGISDEKCVLNDSRQSYARNNGTYELTLRRDTMPAKPVLIPVKDAALQEFVKPTEVYQSEHPEVVRKAREIVGDERNAGRAAQMICLWVFNNVRKKGTVAFSNTLETLRTLEGDCGEHAALFVGLCRAVGLPARMVNGLAYSSSFRAFGGHAWAEAYVGKWIAVDPTFGEPIANPAHIKLVSDDTYLEAARMLGVLGKLKIEVMGEKDE